MTKSPLPKIDNFDLPKAVTLSLEITTSLAGFAYQFWNGGHYTDSLKISLGKWCSGTELSGISRKSTIRRIKQNTGLMSSD